MYQAYIFLTLVLISNLCYASHQHVFTYGNDVCTFNGNGLNRQCSENESGDFIYVRVISCGNDIGNYVLFSSEMDRMIPSSNHVYCTKRFGNGPCPATIDDLSNTNFTYTGSAELCMNYNCSIDGACYCQLAYKGSQRYCGSNKDEPMEILSTEVGLVVRPVSNFAARDVIMSNSSNTGFLPLEDICKLIQEPNRLTLKCNRIITASVNIFSKTLNDVYSFTGSTYHIILPKYYKHHTLPVLLVLTHENQVYYKQFLKEAQTFCNEKTCLFCQEAYQNWDCLSISEQSRFVIVMLLVLFSFFLIIPIIVMLLIALYACSKFLLTKTFYLKELKRRVSFGQIPRSVNESLDRSYVQPSYQPISRSITLSPLIMFCLLVSINCSCDVGITTNAFVSSCNTDLNGVQTCIMSSQTSFSLDYPGQTTCLNIIDNNVSPPLVIGTVEINYLMYVCNSLPTLRYYTSGWTYNAESQTHCFTAGHCDDVDCDTVNTNGFTDRQALGELTSDFLLKYPGQTRCLREPPQAGDFCALPNDGCIFTGYWLQPITYDIRGVYGFDSQFCGAVLDFSIDLVNLNQSSSPAFYQIPSSVTYNETFSNAIFTLDSASNSDSCYDLRDVPAVMSPQMKIIHEAGYSQPGFPQPNIVGDIQGGNLDFIDPYSTNLQINYHLVNVISASINSGAQYIRDTSGVSYCDMSGSTICDSLPYSPDGVNNIIFGQNLDNPAYSQLSSISSICPSGPAITGNFVVQNYTFVREFSTCEFQLELDHISGCYDCDTCAYAFINVNTETDCSATVIGDNVQPRISSIIIAEPQIQVPFCSNNKYLDATLFFTSGEFTESVPLSGSLSDPVLIPNANMFNYTFEYSYVQSESDNFLDGFGSFWDDLFNGHWWSYILFIIVALVVFAILAFCFYQMIVVCVPAMFAACVVKKAKDN